MTVIEILNSARPGSTAERLVCHPRLPLVAAVDAERPAVHVWSFETGRLEHVGSVGAEAGVYGDAFGWSRIKREPGVAWHPDQPLLTVASEGSAVRWTPAGLSEVDGVAPAARYLAFSPDGRTLWASPSSSPEKRDREPASQSLDLLSGDVSTGPSWDTGVAVHPGGGLALTLASDQGATLGLFARVDQEATPGRMRLLRRALILDVDGYETPVFSADGRLFAVRGNAYAHTLEVFEFPSLQRVLATTLSESEQDYSVWSLNNIAFGAEPGVLWIGTPTGTLIEVAIETQSAATHDVLAGAKVTALGATASGGLVVASDGGELVLLAVRADSATDHRANGDRAREAVAAFLDSTNELPDDADLDTDLLLTDGHRTWEADDLEAVTEADDSDPTWLRIQAAVNIARGR